MTISVVIPVYIGDNSKAFEKALNSITVQQSRYPDEVVIVKDGPLKFDLNNVIENIRYSCFKVVRKDINEGIVKALNDGIGISCGEVIVRMDSDDEAFPNRIADTHDFFAKNVEIDMLASSIVERDLTSDKRKYRAPSTFPLNTWFIRNPFFHPATAFRRELCIKNGGYRNFPGFEDFDLWIRFSQTGANIAVTAEKHLIFNVSKDFYERRRGLKYLKNEISWLRLINREQGLEFHFWSNILLRVLLRLSPKFLLEYFYRLRN